MPDEHTLDLFYSRLEEHWKENRLDDAMKVAREAAAAEPYSSEPQMWMGDLWYEMDEWDRALDAYSKALEMEPGMADALAAMGRIYFERCEFVDAAEFIDDALAEDNGNPEASYYKALLLERRGEFKKADGYMAVAHEADPDYYPSTFRMPRKEFEHYVEEALETLSKQVRDFLKNVAVIVEEVPDENDLIAEDPPLSPHLLGLFRGSSAREKTTDSAWSQMPAQVVLYQRNLEHFCMERDELVEQIRITVLHEIGHYLGLNEGDLSKRGLE